MADERHPLGTVDGNPLEPRRRNPLLPENRVQRVAADMVQAACGVRPTPRKRGRPRNPAPASGNRPKRRRTTVSDKDRERIVSWSLRGEALKAIAARLEINHETARSVLRNYRKTGRVHAVKHTARKPRTSQYTDDMKLFVAGLFILNPGMTQALAAAIAALEFGDVSFSKSTIRNFLGEVRFSLKMFVTRKLSWNTEAALQARMGYPAWIESYRHRCHIIYYDEQNFNTNMHRRRGWAPIGRKAVIEKGPRTSNGGALSLHLAVSETFGAVHAMVVTKDADQVTTRQFLEGLATELRKLDERRAAGDNKPWMLVLDNDKQHHTRHVTDFLQAAGLSYCFLPAYSPFLCAIEYVFGNVKGELSKMPTHNWNAFSKKSRTEAQLNSLTRQVLYAVRRSVSPAKVKAFADHTVAFHEACRHGMPIYDGSNPPSEDDVGDWTTRKAAYDREFANEPPDSLKRSSAYRQRMNIVFNSQYSEAERHLVRAADAIEKYEATLLAEMEKQAVQQHPDLRTGSLEWCTAASLDVLQPYLEKQNARFKSTQVQTFVARLQQRIDTLEANTREYERMLSNLVLERDSYYKWITGTGRFVQDALRLLQTSGALRDEGRSAASTPSSAASSAASSTPLRRSYSYSTADHHPSPPLSDKEREATKRSLLAFYDAVQPRVRQAPGAISGAAAGAGAGSGAGSGAAAAAAAAPSPELRLEAGAPVLARRYLKTSLDSSTAVREVDGEETTYTLLKSRALCLHFNLSNRLPGDFYVNKDFPRQAANRMRMVEALAKAKLRDAHDVRVGKQSLRHYGALAMSCEQLNAPLEEYDALVRQSRLQGLACGPQPREGAS